jgi:hypothetical protein
VVVEEVDQVIQVIQDQLATVQLALQVLQEAVEEARAQTLQIISQWSVAQEPINWDIHMMDWPGVPQLLEMVFLQANVLPWPGMVPYGLQVVQEQIKWHIHQTVLTGQPQLLEMRFLQYSARP